MGVGICSIHMHNQSLQQQQDFKKLGLFWNWQDFKKLGLFWSCRDLLKKQMNQRVWNLALRRWWSIIIITFFCFFFVLMCFVVEEFCLLCLLARRGRAWKRTASTRGLQLDTRARVLWPVLPSLVNMRFVSRFVSRAL
jgi:hypothetical protein